MFKDVAGTYVKQASSPAQVRHLIDRAARIALGDEASQRIPNVPYHRFAEMIGLRGIYVDDPKQMGPAWDQTFASDIPVVLEVKTDPEVPPLPSHIAPRQAKNFSLALAKGDPDEVGVIHSAARQVLETILPGKD